MSISPMIKTKHRLLLELLPPCRLLADGSELWLALALVSQRPLLPLATMTVGQRLCP